MKKLTLLSFALALTSLAHAQVYFRAGGGYAAPIATESIGEEHLVKNTSIGNDYTFSNTAENVKASYGAGFNFSVGGGFMISRFFGIDLDVRYLAGKKFETSDKYHYRNDDYSTREENIITTNSQALFITPSFVLTTGAGSKVPYGRFGVVLGAPSIKSEQSYFYNMDGTNTASQKGEYKKGMSLGFQGVVGMNWMLSNTIDLYTEVSFTSMTYYPQEFELTESSYNGVSNLDQLSEYNKKTKYKKKIDVNSEPDTSKPREALLEGEPLSSISFQVGIRYVLGGHVLE